MRQAFDLGCEPGIICSPFLPGLVNPVIVNAVDPELVVRCQVVDQLVTRVTDRTAGVRLPVTIDAYGLILSEDILPE